MGGVGVSGYWLAIDTATDIASVAVGRRAGAGPVQAETGAHARGARRPATGRPPPRDLGGARPGGRPLRLARTVPGAGAGSFSGLCTWAAAAHGLAHVG